jgi:hypothetical protein
MAHNILNISICWTMFNFYWNVMYHIYAQIFFCDGRYCDRKNVMDFNFGKISIENLCIELKYKGDNVLGWGLFKDTTFDSGRPFYCIHHKYYLCTHMDDIIITRAHNLCKYGQCWMWKWFRPRKIRR